MPEGSVRGGHFLRRGREEGGGGRGEKGGLSPELGKVAQRREGPLAPHRGREMTFLQ